MEIQFRSKISNCFPVSRMFGGNQAESMDLPICRYHVSQNGGTAKYFKAEQPQRWSKLCWDME